MKEIIKETWKASKQSFKSKIEMLLIPIVILLCFMVFYLFVYNP